VQGNRRLAGRTVTNDEFALATADGNHGVNGLNARLHRGVHALAKGHTRGDALHGANAIRLDRAFPVDGPAQAVDHATDEFVAHGNFDDAPGRPNLRTFLDFEVVAEHSGTDRLLFEVEGDAHTAVRELQEFR